MFVVIFITYFIFGVDLMNFCWITLGTIYGQESSTNYVYAIQRNKFRE